MKQPSEMVVVSLAVLLGLAVPLTSAAEPAHCVSRSGQVVKGATDSTCLAASDGSGKAAATANGHSASFAVVEAGNKAGAVAMGESIARAESKASQCPSRAAATQNSEALSFCYGSGGVALSHASNSSCAGAEADSSCMAKANATGSGSSSNAECGTPGGFVSVITANGGFAVGSDTAPPQCTPGNGTAKVRSSGGNC